MCGEAGWFLLIVLSLSKFPIFLFFERCSAIGLPIPLFEPVDEVLRSHLSDHSTGGETCFGDVSQHTILAFHR